MSHSWNSFSQKTDISWHMAQHLKFSLRGGKQERKKRKRRNSQAIISLPLQSLRHCFMLHYRMQFFSIILDAYFDFKDTTLSSLSKLNKYSPQYLLQRNPDPTLLSNLWIPWCQLELQNYHQEQFCHRIMHMQSIRMHHIRVASYWPNMKQAVHNKTGYKKYCYTNTQRNNSLLCIHFEFLSFHISELWIQDN